MRKIHTSSCLQRNHNQPRLLIDLRDCISAGRSLSRWIHRERYHTLIPRRAKQLQRFIYRLSLKIRVLIVVSSSLHRYIVSFHYGRVTINRTQVDDGNSFKVARYQNASNRICLNGVEDRFICADETLRQSRYTRSAIHDAAPVRHIVIQRAVPSSALDTIEAIWGYICKKSSFALFHCLEFLRITK